MQNNRGWENGEIIQVCHTGVYRNVPLGVLRYDAHRQGGIMEVDKIDGDLVYIAAPYTEGAWETNLIDVIDMAETIVNRGDVPFIPHTMTTLWALREPKSKEDWLAIDLAILERCDKMVRLEGESEGAEMEVGFAQANGIPVYTHTSYIKPTGELTKVNN